MRNIKVSLGENSYDVEIGSQDFGKRLAPFVRAGRLLGVTDSNVAAAVAPELEFALKAAGIDIAWFTLPAGEGAKSWSQLEALTNWLLDNHVERSDHIIALGGGVVGDITGFAAHIVKRGCSFIQIPTTLLAQVDSSVGGKTAINAAAGKNLIGAFHQPALVLIEPAVLGTLPRRELAAGFAEVIKYGLIDDPGFFDWCDENIEAFFGRDQQVREYAIAHSVEAKARIVAEDERELTGTRALLNLGHTFGHALEADTGYSERLLHGEAVACGMALAFRYSARRGHCPAEDAQRAASVLHKAGLPTTLSEAGVTANGATLVEHMLHDKKKAGGTLPFLLANGIGKTFLAKDVDLADVAAFLDEETQA